MLIRTTSLAYDDRVRKEALSLSKRKDSKVEICAFENEEVPFTLNNVNIIRKTIKLRRYFTSNRLVTLKLIEMYYRFIMCVIERKPSVIWLHNFESAPLIPLLKLRNYFFKKKIIILWDQHELPPSFFYKNKFGKIVYRKIMSMVHKNVMATKSRIDFINKRCKIKDNIYSVENFPDSAFINHKPDDLDPSIERWLNGEVYCLCQGGYSDNRAFKEIVEAFITLKKKVVFVGPKNEKLLNETLSQFKSSELEKYCLFLNSVPQMELTCFIDHSIASIVFYKRINSNNWLCAPNRFYQSLARGRPVITGENPLFVETISDSHLGFVAQTDGSSSTEIVKTLNVFFSNYLETEITSKFNWENQETLLYQLVDVD